MCVEGGVEHVGCSTANKWPGAGCDQLFVSELQQRWNKRRPNAWLRVWSAQHGKAAQEW